jgi:hypothetical protein
VAATLLHTTRAVEPAASDDDTPNAVTVIRFGVAPNAKKE